MSVAGGQGMVESAMEKGGGTRDKNDYDDGGHRVGFTVTRFTT